MSDVIVFVEIPSGSRNKYEFDPELGGDRARPAALHVDELPGRLRLHRGHARRGRRPARRARARRRADLPRLPDPLAAGRRLPHDRREGARREGDLRAARGPVLPHVHDIHDIRSSSATRSSTSSRSTRSSRRRRPRRAASATAADAERLILPRPATAPCSGARARRSAARCVAEELGPSSRSSTWMRSSAEWTSSDATSGSIVRIGKKPYATVPNASRIQWLSVKPAPSRSGRPPPAARPARTNDATASQSGPSAATASRRMLEPRPARSRPRRARRGSRLLRLLGRLARRAAGSRR